MSNKTGPDLQELYLRLNKTLDPHRADAKAVRHKKGYRIARENLFDLVDEGSFLEYGQLAVAAHLEIDAVIDPVDTRVVLVNALAAATSYPCKG
jgi:acetyl-CoA carboxylase carboxyltransferase component